jgi:hypothetical protein
MAIGYQPLMVTLATFTAMEHHWMKVKIVYVLDNRCSISEQKFYDTCETFTFIPLKYFCVCILSRQNPVGVSMRHVMLQGHQWCGMLHREEPSSNSDGASGQ